MPECFTIMSNEIDGRIDPFYYRPYFKEQIKHLSKTKFTIAKLKDICTKITDGTHFTPRYVKEGVPFISVKDVRENKISFDNIKYISKDEHKKLIKRCKPESGDILLTKVGTVGIATVIPQNAPEFSIFVSVALLKIDKTKANPYYVSTYLNSKYTKVQIERVLKGIGVPDFHLENIAEIKIPLPPLSIQNKIVQLMDNAYQIKKQKETEAQQLLDSINDYVLSELGIKLPELKDQMTFVVYANDVKGKRIDAYYYQPKFEEVEKAIEEGKFEVKSLKEITKLLINGLDFREFVDEGVMYLRVSNIRPNRFNLSDVVFIPNMNI
ncbi:Type I restriction modification DNA specificity domain protein [Candidatus Methanoperedenaceae archaeon GB37]|nr:Type I restriction modification DNA specificity domain protein [Candidatus Methanoperedenaceae archaeon GB37]